MYKNKGSPLGELWKPPCLHGGLSTDATGMRRESKLWELTFLRVLCFSAVYMTAQIKTKYNPQTRGGPGEHGAAADFFLLFFSSFY